MVLHRTYLLSRESVPDWVFTDYVFAENIFWLQHWLYVSFYLKVAVMTPLTFRVQTDTVKKQRKWYGYALLAINLTAFMALATTLTVELALSVNRWVLGLVWSFYSIVLTWTLCTALKRIRSYAKAMN